MNCSILFSEYKLVKNASVPQLQDTDLSNSPISGPEPDNQRAQHLKAYYLLHSCILQSWFYITEGGDKDGLREQ